MIAQGMDVLFPQVVLCGSAAVQCIAEDHDSPALCNICHEHLHLQPELTSPTIIKMSRILRRSCTTMCCFVGLAVLHVLDDR